MGNEKKRVTSTDIKLALKEMHLARSSYFITECKNGSTYFPPAQGLSLEVLILIIGNRESRLSSCESAFWYALASTPIRSTIRDLLSPM